MPVKMIDAAGKLLQINEERVKQVLPNSVLGLGYRP